jgi:hypothetical protein
MTKRQRHELMGLVERRIETGVPLRAIEALIEEHADELEIEGLKLWAWAWQQTQPAVLPRRSLIMRLLSR